LVICCNGALVYDLTRETVVAHVPLPPETARTVVAALRAAVPGACFAVEVGRAYGREPAYAALAAAGEAPAEAAGARLDDALALCAVPVTKLIVRHPEHAPEALLAAVRGLGDARLEATHSGAPFVEISAAGVHKARALAALCADLGIDRQAVVAFGDMPNDLPMLAWAGHGVAVANAHPEVLARAVTVAPPNAADGVARALTHLLRLRGGEARDAGCPATTRSCRPRRCENGSAWCNRPRRPTGAPLLP
jgi:hydroxymethylpyrimidine pyrophosphatase-like HAD family hydrolase